MGVIKTSIKERLRRLVQVALKNSPKALKVVITSSILRVPMQFVLQVQNFERFCQGFDGTAEVAHRDSSASAALAVR